MKTSLKPLEYLRTLSPLVGLSGQFLVSAFDLSSSEDKRTALRLMEASRAAGATVLMDSGNYESFWKDARSTWSRRAFHEALVEFPCDLAFAFDEQQPPTDFKEHIELIVDGWRDDQRAAGDCLMVPIIHGTPAALPALCARVAVDTSVSILAVAERRLGEGVTERAKTVQAIRHALDSQGRFVALHLLGTGNPISIALYSTMGADTFDGLEWCQTAVDHETGLLHHLTHADFYAGQSKWSDGTDLSFQARTLAHNLSFYADWMSRLQRALAAGCAVDFCRYNFPRRAFDHCAAAFNWNVT